MEAMLPLFEPKGRVLLVDGHHLAYRTFFALKGLTTSRGEPVQAVYGFAKSLLKALKEDGYKAVFVVFDAKAPSFRHEAYEAYKAGRAPTPEDFPRQLALIKELVDLLGFTRPEVPGYEADDVLATLAKKAEKEGYEVRILTADRDLYQLVSDRVAVLHPEGHLITPEWLWEKYGLRPEQWVDFRALVGDPSDNLPGVKGIGEKTALKLLKEWGSLENLLKNLDRVKPENVREKIKAHLEDLRLSLELSRVRTDLPLEVDLAQGREPDREGLRAFLERLEFGSLLHEFGLLEAPAPLEEAPWPPPEGAFVGFVLSRPEPMWAELKALAACRDGRVHRAADPLAGLKDLKEVRGLLAKDLAVLASREGLDLVPGDDPMLLAYLLDPSNTTPEGVARRYGGEWTEDAAHRALLSERLHRNLLKRLGGGEAPLALPRGGKAPLPGPGPHGGHRGTAGRGLPSGPFPGACGGDPPPPRRRSSAWRATPSTSTPGTSWKGCSLTSLGFPPWGRRKRQASAPPAPRCWRPYGRPTPSWRRSSSTGSSPSSRTPTWTPSQASSTRGRAASTPASTRRPRPRGGLVAPTPTCRTSPSAPPWARGSAGPSWPRRVGRWWPWTIAR